jgi:hypothetical protein
VRYRQYAANCVRAAQEVTDQTIRASLFDMAQIWLMLVDHCEQPTATTRHAAEIAFTAQATAQETGPDRSQPPY